MLWITQYLKTLCPTKIKIIDSGMHFPESQYYDPFLIITFSCFTQQGMNEEHGKRAGAKPITLYHVVTLCDYKCFVHREY